MSNQTPEPETVIRRAIDASMRRMNTAEPGVIESYDAATCTADVQPLIMRVRLDEGGERVAEKAPVLTDVPVYFPGGGGMRLTFPVRRGDTCLLIMSSQPLDQWAGGGSAVDPKSTRHHHISDAIAFVGLTAAQKGVTANSTATVLEGSDVRLGDSSAQLLALKSDVQNLRDYVNEFVSNLYNIHTHAGVQAGGGVSGVTGMLGDPPGNPTGTVKTRAS